MSIYQKNQQQKNQRQRFCERRKKYTKGGLILLAFIGMGLASSCGNKSDEQLEQEVSSGVVLVQNQSYYEVVLSNGESIYFSSFDDEDGVKGFATEEDSVEVVTSYGTGFFISEDGKIATNAHVVSNTVSDKDVNKSISSLISVFKKYFYGLYSEADEKYEKAVAYCNVALYDDDVSVEEYHKYRDIRDAIKKVRDEYAEFYNGIDEIRASESEIKYHNEVSIAYNDTYVTSTKDFISCVVTQTDAEHDLAIIQIKDKKTPEGKYVFSLEEEDPLETYTWDENLTRKISKDKNSKLFMTSFNLGPKLALTKEGIKSQFNNGSISQKTDEKIMYSIPALPGSSGSPVINLQGQLVAINFSGLNGTQNFNYGIRVKYLKNLIDK
ncbi:MAG: trypsin-like peptidase domain-containing protein [Prevotella sp.]|nr:trypsin-like peptidase domain-containing protein [Prevotella sp.]